VRILAGSIEPRTCGGALSHGLPTCHRPRYTEGALLR
jgi:hypothetical protein